MLNYKDIFPNNKKWIAEKKKINPEVFEELSKNQDPSFLLITCCDSRVAPLQMMGAEPGEVFIHRNIANIVNHDDPNCMAAIEYAIQYLNVKHVVVCGHYYCGGVIAAGDSTELDIIEPWIKPIRVMIEANKSTLVAIKDPDEQHRTLVRKHVLEQCKHVISSPPYQKAMKKKIAPQVHGWVLDLKSGEVVELT